MKGTGLYLTLLLGCLLYQAATNEEQSAVQTRRLVHSPVAGNYRGGGYGGSGYSTYSGYNSNGYKGRVYGGYGYGGRGNGGHGYGGHGYGGHGYGGYGYGGRGNGGHGYGGYGSGGYGYGGRGYGGYGYGGRGCRYGIRGYNRRSGDVRLYINLLRSPKYSTGKAPFSSHYLAGGSPLYGGSFYSSSIIGNWPSYNNYKNAFPSWNYGSSLGGGKSSGFSEYFSYIGGGGGLGKGY